MVAKNSSIFNSKKLPFGFLLALLMILIFESLNVLFDDYFYRPPYDGLRIKVKNELSVNPKNKFDFLILGDCYPLIGIIPKIIEDRTGLTGFNFFYPRRLFYFLFLLLFQELFDDLRQKTKICRYFILARELSFNKNGHRE